MYIFITGIGFAISHTVQYRVRPRVCLGGCSRAGVSRARVERRRDCVGDATQKAVSWRRHSVVEVTGKELFLRVHQV